MLTYTQYCLYILKPLCALVHPTYIGTPVHNNYTPSQTHSYLITPLQTVELTVCISISCQVYIYP